MKRKCLILLICTPFLWFGLTTLLSYVPFDLEDRLPYDSWYAAQRSTASLEHDSNPGVRYKVDKEPILSILNSARADHAVSGARSNTFYGTDAGFFTLFIDGVSLEVSEKYMMIRNAPHRENEYVRLLDGAAENLWNCLEDSYFSLNP